jgi:undecaprenyl-diphosphatase
LEELAGQSATINLMSVGQALLLGVVQGLTEFLPVSSTAHLYIAQALLGIRNDALTLSFDVVLHLGTAAALVLALGRELAAISRELVLWVGGKPARDPIARALLLPLVVGTVPGVLAGLFLLKRVEAARTLGLIGLSMLVACGYFLYAEHRGGRASRERDLSSVSAFDALWIGLAQAAAGLMAGFSRSGFTISTARVRGFSRPDAARFSFLLALPIILGAGAKALLDLRRAPEPPVTGAVLAAGFLAAAIVGFLAVKLLLRYLKTHTLRPFAAYLGALGLLLLAVSIAQHLPLLAGR